MNGAMRTDTGETITQAKLEEIPNTLDTTVNTLLCNVEIPTTQQANPLQSKQSSTSEMQTVAKTTEQYVHNP